MIRIEEQKIVLITLPHYLIKLLFVLVYGFHNAEWINVVYFDQRLGAAHAKRWSK